MVNSKAKYSLNRTKLRIDIGQLVDGEAWFDFINSGEPWFPDTTFYSGTPPAKNIPHPHAIEVRQIFLA